MLIRNLILAAILTCGLVMPVHAADERNPPDLDEALAQALSPEAWLGGRISEADVDLLFAYLKASLIGSTYGRDVPVPEELKRRAEALGRELRMHGLLTGLLLLQALEARAKQALPDPPPGDPPSRRL